ncbi:MAG: histidine kinase, partial [Bifidobacteriaceae bacterium]|nr:histidine kinase [Bifidobacteriaceae bacterium]
PSLADDLVAVVREGLSNAGRHAKAASVTVTVALVTPAEGPAGAPGEVTVIVEDDGVGLPSDRHRQSGLSNLADRAAHRGGSFTAAPRSDGRGTRLEWVVPLS